MTPNIKMQVICISPLDNFHEYCLSVDQWFAKIRSSPTKSMSAAHIQYLQAIAAVSKHPYWDWDVASFGHVLYNPLTDQHDDPCFIFKTYNNGSTFIVAQQLPPISLFSGNTADPEIIEVEI